MAKAQVQARPQPAIANSSAPSGPSAPPPSAPLAVAAGLYPNLHDEYMGLNLTQYRPPAPAHPAGAVVVSSGSAVATRANSGPVSGVGNVGIRRAEIKQGVREVVVCKDAKGKVGVSLFAESKGIFVSYVKSGSPASMAGLRFGDQILQIDGEVVAGFSNDKASKAIKKASATRISLALRDRPFERTITMQKDSANHVGFSYNNGEIKAIVKDSSAARNGLLIDHYLCEANGQNVIGLKDKDIAKIFDESPRTVTITIMPKFIYDHLMKNMGKSLKKSMDHSIPDV